MASPSLRAMGVGAAPRRTALLWYTEPLRYTAIAVAVLAVVTRRLNGAWRIGAADRRARIAAQRAQQQARGRGTGCCSRARRDRRGRRGRPRLRAHRRRRRRAHGGQHGRAARPAAPTRRSSPRSPPCPPRRSTRSGPEQTTAPPTTISGAAADQRRQAGGALHRRRVLPLLRGRAVGDDRRAQPVRHASAGWPPPTRRPRTAPGNAEPYPNTATWTFANADATPASYLTFTPVEDVHQRPRPVHRLLHPAADAHRGAAGAAQQVRRRQQRRDPVHRLRQQVPERRRLLQPRRAGRADLDQIAADLHNSGSPVAAGGARRGQLHRPRRSAGSPTTSRRPRARRRCSRCRRRSNVDGRLFV